ncbi:hypothetical protein [Roseovarius sp. SYSU LYC5161]|uniref:hypothetical protein n=1 Tax=Roseovarius halophilus (ex Wu et al. 2025) TaxID=3376060 RepID=UPI00399ACA77
MHRRQFLTLAPALIAAPAVLRAQDDTLKLRELYEGRDFSPLARDLEGTTIDVDGYMAPPLQADSTFFVLTKIPMSVCPFCETEAEWPDDILAIYTRRKFDTVPFNRKIVVTGALALGSYRDPDTGFLSMVRLENARLRFG